MQKFNLNDVSYDAVIPSVLLFNHNIEPAAVKCYAVIRSLSRAEGYCFAGDEYLAEALGAGKRTISRWIESLKKEGFLEIHITNTQDEHGHIKSHRKIFISEEFKKFLRNAKNGESAVTPKMACYKGSIDKDMTNLSSSEVLVADAPHISRPTSANAMSDPPLKEISSKLKKSEIPEKALELAKYQLEAIKRIKPNVKPPKIENWAKEIDKLNRLDGRSWEDIKSMIDWVEQDKFWVNNLLSAGKLRRNWDQMEMKKSPPENKGNIEDKNRKLAYEVREYLRKTNEHNLLSIRDKYVRNNISNDQINLDLHPDKFKDIVLKWFGIRVK